MLASTGVLRQLAALGVAIEIDSASARETGISHLERLQLHGPAGHAMGAIARAATGLVALTADHVTDGSFETGFPALVDLDVHVSGDWLRVVRPLAPRLQRLAVTGQACSRMHAYRTVHGAARARGPSEARTPAMR